MDTQDTDNKGKKRRRSDDALAKAYKGVKFTPIESTERPGTPHCYFRESYRVEFLQDDEQGESLSSPLPPPQIVHSHVNGLVVVTAGNSVMQHDTVESIQLLVKKADVASQSAASKRKQKAKMLRGKNVQDAVFPKDELATVTCREAATTKSIPLRCCVWGSVLEVNPNLTPQLLQEDPLLDGYLAVILPSGPFPPKDETLEESKQSPKVAKLEDTKGGEVTGEA